MKLIWSKCFGILKQYNNGIDSAEMMTLTYRLAERPSGETWDNLLIEKMKENGWRLHEYVFPWFEFENDNGEKAYAIWFTSVDVSAI